MKAAAFDYVRAKSVAEAVQLLTSFGDGARLIAGGQSLLPAMNFRLILPSHLIDIGGIRELRGISAQGSGLRIGAGTRHADLQKSELIAGRAPLIALAMPHIAHPAIRNRGTIGGNLAHADPASELPACMVALNATLVATGPRGERSIHAADFFKGLYATALEPNEILTAIEVPARPGNERSYFKELARRLGDYAIVGLACVARIKGAELEDIRPVFFGVGDKPMVANQARAAILKSRAVPPTNALKTALARDFTPPDDLQASAGMRLHLCSVLLHRCLLSLKGGENAA